MYVLIYLRVKTHLHAIINYVCMENMNIEQF